MAQKDHEEIERLTEALRRVTAQRDEAIEDRDARRDSLAQELRGVLFSRGMWTPSEKRNACDLITAFGKALDDMRAEVEELTAARDRALARAKNLDVASAMDHAVAEAADAYYGCEPEEAGMHLIILRETVEQRRVVLTEVE